MSDTMAPTPIPEIFRPQVLLIDEQQRTSEANMMTDKAARILQKMKERDRKTLKRWIPYQGPEDWDFAVLNAPHKESEDRRDERPEVSDG